MNWNVVFSELIRRTTSDLPADVVSALQQAVTKEVSGSQAAMLLHAMLKNSELAREQSTPLCQDTGTLTFFFQVPQGTDTRALTQAARDAVINATQAGWLRRNTIETISGSSVDTNIADGCPVCHFEQWERPDTEVWLIQKGGGCENMSMQFSLPDAQLAAGRDLEGVRRCLLEAAWRAQGYGCAPGILGVCIGADRAEGYAVAKAQLLRALDDNAPDPELMALEQRVLAEVNQLGIGPMGMGGQTTLLGVKIASRSRLPASYFVTVAYMCWSCRRRGVRVTAETPLWLG